MVELFDPNTNRVLLAVRKACPGMPRPGPEVFKGPFLPPKGHIIDALSLAQCHKGPEFPGASPPQNSQVTNQREHRGESVVALQNGSRSEEVQRRRRT